MDIRRLFQLAKQHGASDIHITVGAPPHVRIEGELTPVSGDRLTPQDTEYIVRELLTETQLKQLMRSGQYDGSHGISGLGRYRINAYRSRSSFALVARVIPTEVPTLRDLALPAALAIMAEQHHGLVLVTGPTGSGKSTTLAAMVDHVNSNLRKHIITLEHPIEYLHRHKRSLVNQREIGFDTLSFGDGLKAALRQDPDVLVIGELRDMDTIQIALTAAETGHLVMATLHTVSAPATIERVVDAFPQPQQAQVRMQLGSVLVGIGSQRLLQMQNGRGRVCAIEILVGSQAVRNLIRNDKLHQLESTMQTGRQQGMQTMAMAVDRLMRDGFVAPEVAAPYLQVS